MPLLMEAVKALEKEFLIDDEFLRKGTDAFNKSLDNGLKAPKVGREFMPMIPAFVTKIPTGKEKGVYLAADLGGTNFRVCSVDLHGDHTYSLIQSKSAVSEDLQRGSDATGEQLFAYLAKKIDLFIREHHCTNDVVDSSDKFKMGFTFSFPVEQTSLGSGLLIRWTKGFHLDDVIGKDVVELLQAQLDKLGTPVHVVALANDTVGTLLSRAYSNKDSEHVKTIVGCIFGTGTNGAYFEAYDKIPKLKENIDTGSGMVINTEWGSFDNPLTFLPKTKYDDIVDNETSNIGYHLYEKRISGMFLGELVRVILIDLFEQGVLFKELYESRGGSLPHRLTEPWGLSSEILSYIHVDDSNDLKTTQVALDLSLRLPTTCAEREAIQQVTRIVADRAAKLSAIPIAAIAKRVSPQYPKNVEFEIGCDGSVVEFYPGFREKVTQYVNELDTDGRTVRLVIAKDGSGVGAALCACMAD
ncbi:glucokinase [Scheffersomyces spartinae]|uniref:Phosphotransferase n=1 Tax=Scheffersomyces spartinae TaxID=45513 RepID=A0A9P8AHG6_9ASCO|nr:glucokinase [Scheffersomyces spartinae]KAG7192776.1 glucokinase [Scheffersomyces spartinae]